MSQLLLMAVASNLDGILASVLFKGITHCLKHASELENPAVTVFCMYAYASLFFPSKCCELSMKGNLQSILPVYLLIV